MTSLLFEESEKSKLDIQISKYVVSMKVEITQSRYWKYYDSRYKFYCDNPSTVYQLLTSRFAGTILISDEIIDNQVISTNY